MDFDHTSKEIDIGLAADVGTLNRLPKIIGNHSLLHEIAFTGRNLPADEAYQMGLVSKVLATKVQFRPWCWVEWCSGGHCNYTNVIML